MAQAPIIPPTPISTGLQWLTERAPVAQASANAFYAGQFVKQQGSGDAITLITCTAGGTSEPVYGLAQKGALASTAEPYLTPTGTTASVISPVNTEFWVTCTANAATVGNGTADALVIGASYPLIAYTSGAASGLHALNTTTSSGAGFFVYTGKVYPGYVDTDTNVPVSVRLVSTLIQ